MKNIIRWGFGVILAISLSSCSASFKNLYSEYIVGPDPGPMKVVYLPRKKVKLYTKLTTGGWGDGRGLYYCGKAYIADDLLEPERSGVILHEYQHHLGYIWK